MKDNSKRARERRQSEAKERQEKYDALSLEEKIARAETRPGNSAIELAGLRAQQDS